MEQEELTEQKIFTLLLHFLSETKKMVTSFHETGKVKKKKSFGFRVVYAGEG